MKFLVFTVLSLLLIAKAWSSEDGCSSGPTYWCQNLFTARQCGAVKHCTDRVWLLQKPNAGLMTYLTTTKQSSQSDYRICSYCMFMVRGVNELLTGDRTQAEILRYMNKKCGELPTSEGARACTNAVDEFFPAILNFISKEMDPLIVCQAMGLCTKVENLLEILDRRTNEIQQDPLLARVTLLRTNNYVKNVVSFPQKENDEVCDMCKTTVQELQAAAKDNQTKQEIIQAFDNMCDMIPEGELITMCKNLVNTYVPALIDAFAAMDPETLCKDVGLCQATEEIRKLYQAVKKLISLRDSSESCDMCMDVVKEIRDVVKQAETALTDVAVRLCQLCPVEKKCVYDVKKGLHEFFAFIESALAPDMICQMIGLCPKPGDQISPLELSPAKPVVAQTFIKMPVKQLKPVNEVKASIECVICEFVMKELDEILSDNATQEEIEAALDKVCSLLPSTISQECKNFIDVYGPIVLELLVQELTPDVVCTTIGLCSSKRIMQAAVVIKETEVCTLCETVIKYVDALLEKPSTEKEITRVVEKVCNFLPKDVRNDCDTFVDTYGPYVIQLLAQMAQPQEVCSMIKACKDNEVVKPHLLGEKKCTYGPAYWCASRANADECNAVEHCKKHVWKN